MSGPSGAQVHLSEFCSGENAPALVSQLLERQGSDLVVDASAIEFIDTQCVEVLVAAAHQWAGDALSIHFENPSEGFLRGLSALGLDRSAVEIARTNDGR
ncbi:MAG: STAS domain-containing protein [Notoacmeibacter sp.]|nr:STAS domain-containing protein [Notoacmeibacter sp.]